MTLEERLKNNPPANSKANVKGGDKTLIEADGGLDLSADQAAIKKAGGREIGQGAGGYAPSKTYSDTFK
jgi:hypothetical protein